MNFHHNSLKICSVYCEKTKTNFAFILISATTQFCLKIYVLQYNLSATDPLCRIFCCFNYFFTKIYLLFQLFVVLVVYVFIGWFVHSFKLHECTSALLVCLLFLHFNCTGFCYCCCLLLLLLLLILHSCCCIYHINAVYFYLLL